MKWKRIEAGVYVTGRASGGFGNSYMIERLDCGEWFAFGPGVDQCFPTKASAQLACRQAATAESPG